MFLLKTLSQSKYLLSAMTGILLSSSAFAGTAGRVNFISGEVTATTTNNSTHTLYKGDLISAGDKLETGKNGRVQIRFTDGSILSLKPNSVFSIEKYNFSKDTPEQGNLLFNFVRGGFRTISGAIGKANRNNYGMNTPFATIGIRGTDYSAATSNGKVFVTVTDGQVNINNEAGDANANAGESYVIGDKTAPTRCHVSELLPSVKKPTTPVIPEPCSPVIVPLEAEDGFLISTQKIKKPIQENYKNYGHYAEAMRQYTALLNEANQLTNEEISSLTLGQLADTDLTQTDINRNTALKNRPLADALDATEMRDASAINDFMQQYTALSLVNNIDAKDLLKPKQPNTISKDTVVNVIDNGLELKLNQIFESLFSSLVSTTTTNNFLGTDTVIIGADFGSPDIDVKFGTDRTDFLSVTLAPALRDKDELIGLGVLQPSVLAMDANSDNKLRGFSFRQGIMHDNDGIASNKNSGSLVIGDGSAQQSTVVFTDDTTPVSVKISLGDRTNTTINTESILEVKVKVKTPKLAIKVGDIYVSNSDSSAEDIDKNGSSNLGAPEVLATGQDGGKLISIMGSAEIILGAANIGVKLEHHNDLVSRIIDGIYVIPSFSILADASIKDGLTINNLSLKDADGAIKGGVLKIGGIKVSDYNSTNLNAKLAINIEKPSLTSKSGGLLLTLKQLGDAMNGIDIAINNLSVGSDKASDIGDIQMIGLNIHGANLLLRGH